MIIAMVLEWNVRPLLHFMLVVQPIIEQCVAPPMLNRQHTMAVDSESGSVCADVQCSVCVLKARKRKGMLANQHIAISQPLGTAGGAQASCGALSYTGFGSTLSDCSIMTSAWGWSRR